MSTYATIETWEKHEGGAEGYNPEGALVVEVSPLENQAQAAKWGEAYRPGRSWAIYLPSGEIVRGRSGNLPAAKRDALAELEARCSA